MAVIADEEDRAAVWQINLHAHQTVRVTWEVVQRDALAEVEAALVEGLPVPVCEIAKSVNGQRMQEIPPPRENGKNVQIQLQIMLQINTHIRPRRHTPKRTPQLPIMHPNLNILPIKEQIQPARMIQMQMPDNNLLDILNSIPRSLNLRIKLMLRLVPHPREHIRQLRSPDGGVVLS